MPVNLDVPELDSNLLHEWRKSDERYQDLYELTNTYYPEIIEEMGGKYSDFKSHMMQMELGGVYWIDTFVISTFSERRFRDTGKGLYVGNWDKHFPDLVEFFEKLPTQGNFWRMGFLSFNYDFVERQHPTYDGKLVTLGSSPIHVDESFAPDFRIVFDQTDQELLFYPWQEHIYQNILQDNMYVNNHIQNDRRFCNHFIDESNIEKCMEYILDHNGIAVPKDVVESPVSPTFNKKNHVYMLNSRTAAHAGAYKDALHAKDKVTFVAWKTQPWNGKLKPEQQFVIHELEHLINSSIDKYGEHIITRDGTLDIHCR